MGKPNTQLKNIVAGREKKEVISKEILSFDDEIFKNTKYGEFLIQKGYEIALINVKGSLALGKILEEVAQTLSREEGGEGTYLKWLEYMNINRITSWRNRTRYKLYIEAEKEDVKELIAILPFKYIQIINNFEEKTKILPLLENTQLKEAIFFLDELDKNNILSKKTEKENYEEEINFSTFFKKYKVKINEISEEKKEKINSLLKEIESLLKEDSN